MSALLQRFPDVARRNPVLVVSLVVIVLCVTASWFLWRHQETLSGEHAQTLRNGEAMIQSLASQSRIALETARLDEVLAYVDRHLINEGDLAENIGYFYEIEAASRIKFEQVSQMTSPPQAPDQPFRAVPFTLRTSGTYRQMLRLIRELENGPRLLRIRTFSLSAEGVDPDTLTLDLTVELLARP